MPRPTVVSDRSRPCPSLHEQRCSEDEGQSEARRRNLGHAAGYHAPSALGTFAPSDVSSRHAWASSTEDTRGLLAGINALGSSVCPTLDDIVRGIGTDERVPGHSAPGGKVGRSAWAVRNDLEPLARVELQHSASKQHDELATSHVTCIPVVHRVSSAPADGSGVKAFEDRRRRDWQDLTSLHSP